MGILTWYAKGLVHTILIECSLAFALGIRSPRGIARLALVQALTNPLVLSAVSLAIEAGAAGGRLQTVVVAVELSVVALEAFLIGELVPPSDLGRCRIRST